MNILFVDDLPRKRSQYKDKKSSSDSGCSVQPGGGSLSTDSCGALLNKGSACTARIPGISNEEQACNVVILSKNDNIVPSLAIESYLRAKITEGSTHFQVEVFEGTHGTLLANSEVQY